MFTVCIGCSRNQSTKATKEFFVEATPHATPRHATPHLGEKPLLPDLGKGHVQNAVPDGLARLDDNLGRQK